MARERRHFLLARAQYVLRTIIDGGAFDTMDAVQQEFNHRLRSCRLFARLLCLTADAWGCAAECSANTGKRVCGHNGRQQEDEVSWEEDSVIVWRRVRRRAERVASSCGDDCVAVCLRVYTSSAVIDVSGGMCVCVRARVSRCVCVCVRI